MAWGEELGDIADDGLEVWFDNTPPHITLGSPENGVHSGNPFVLYADAGDNLALERILFLFDDIVACSHPPTQMDSMNAPGRHPSANTFGPL